MKTLKSTNCSNCCAHIPLP